MKNATRGFGLTELLITTDSIGISSNKTIPNYSNQISRSRQNEATAQTTGTKLLTASTAGNFRILLADLQMKNRRNQNGFTLSELMISVAIIGILGSIVLPSYSRQLERTKQNNMAATMEQLLVRVVSSKEEIGIAPTTWEELNDQAAIMTKSGPASTSSGTLNQSIDIAGSSYTVKRKDGESDSNYYIFAANTNDNSKRNILGCIDLGTGASDVKLGVEDSSTKSAVKDSDLNCK